MSSGLVYLVLFIFFYKTTSKKHSAKTETEKKICLSFGPSHDSPEAVSFYDFLFFHIIILLFVLLYVSVV